MAKLSPPPPGHVHLYRAVADVGRLLHRERWTSVRCQDELKNQVDAGSQIVDSTILKIAEACVAGKLQAAYRSATGVNALDRSHWSAPHWRTYFSLGTIDLDLPYVNYRSTRLLMDGETVRCTDLNIFVRKDSLADFVAELKPAPLAAARYPGDAALIEEGRRMVADGMQKRAVARKLAPRAEGAGTLTSIEDRLRKAL